MRGVAGKAPLFTIDRGVGNHYLFAFLLMAIETERIDALENKLRDLRCVRLVARLTHPFFERCMIHLSAGL
jgi:hypothetical protein